MERLRIGIVGYGNLGKGVELAVSQNQDMELVAVFSRRSLGETSSGVPVVSIEERAQYQDAIDIMVLCGGSATDLVAQGPQFAALYHTVDSYDTHAKIPEYFAVMDSTAKAAGKVSTISVGWDPGLFSLNRVLAGSVLPRGTDYTFWGKGVSQGHSDALRRIPGVRDAKQYTIPKQELIDAVRSGQRPSVPANEAHIRDCYVVAEPGADLGQIEIMIKTMAHYFAGYETVVTFVSEQEFQAKHSGIPHGGFVFRAGETSPGVNHVFEFALKLDSNPEFTASVLAAYARATFRLAQNGVTGACTVFDIPIGWLSPKPVDALRRELL
jgi:diaminopimelate dehydrogenase